MTCFFASRRMQRITWSHGSRRRARRAAPRHEGDNSRLVRSYPHQLLAEIGALQQSHERFRRAVQSFRDEFAMLDLAFTHPPRHIAQKVRMSRGEVADDKA